MSARILVVDDVPANVKLLEARLSAEYFDVLTAANGAEALQICAARRMRHHPARRDDARHGRLRGLPPPEVQSGDAFHSGGDGHRARQPGRPRARARGRRRRFPDQAGVRHRADRARALADAAEDDDRRAAHARARPRSRSACRRRSAARSPIPARAAASCWSTTGSRPMSASRRCSPPSTTVDVEPNPAEALFHAAEGNYDLADRLARSRQFRRAAAVQPGCARWSARAHVPILAIADAENNARLLRGLEIGVNDYLLRPIDKNELLARVAHADPAPPLSPTICATTCRTRSRWRSPTR